LPANVCLKFYISPKQNKNDIKTYKKLKVIIGPITKERRLLPQTPGISVSKKPPPKPRREGDNSVSIHCSVILFYHKLQVYLCV
jgi:hypothetical protein